MLNASLVKLTSIRRVPEIPCEHCGQPRSFLGGVQWCDSCGWNLESALAKVRRRAIAMSAVACIVLLGDALLFLVAPIAGFIWLPLAILIAGALLLDSQRDYRSIRAARTTLHSYARPGEATGHVAISRLQNLNPEFRYLALAPVIFGIAIFLGVSLMPAVSLPARLAFLTVAFLFALVVGRILFKERRIVKHHAATLARITAFERGLRHRRTAVYEYRAADGKTVSGNGGELFGYSVGMSVPVLYNKARENESLLLPDFLFYRIRSEID